MSENLGIYIHVPFCVSKCAYCDFYSLKFKEDVADRYVDVILHEIDRWGAKLKRSADTLYFGGGTPSLLKSSQISKIIDKCKSNFLLKDSEITVEINPTEKLEQWLVEVEKAGVNRVSLGLQSGIDSELKILSRRHSRSDVFRTVSAIKNVGIENFSLDLMLGIPEQNENSLIDSLDFAVSLQPKHISAYMMTLEENTPFYRNRHNLNFPSADETAELYLKTCNFLNKNGYERYEISNFAKDGIYSRHNLKYWKLHDYLGLGPGAHSMINGKRFYYEKSLEDYIDFPKEIYEGTAGDAEERIMLSLRIKDGISFNELKSHYPDINFDKMIKKTDLYIKNGLMKKENDRVFFSNEGAVVSNSIIAQLLLTMEN